MDTTIIQGIVVAVIVVLVVDVVLTAVLSSRDKAKMSHQLHIAQDGLERHQKDNIHLKAELKRINSLDNLFFSRMIRLTSRLNPEEICKEVTDLLVSYLSVNEIALFLSDERGRKVSIVSHRGLNDEWIPKLVYQLHDKSKIGKVGVCFEKKLPIGEQDFAMLGISEPFPLFNPKMCYPLFYQEKKFGVIAITRESDLGERERNLLGVVSAISGIALNNARIAHTDSLTQLYNIGYFRELLDTVLDSARRFERTISIAILDLDNFKAYNDTFGHQAGDLLLMQLAQMFTRHFNTNEIIARYGGDEFIVMYPDVTKKRAARIIGELLIDLKNYDFTRGHSELKVTFSAGVSSYPVDAINAAELIRMADLALYEAKGAGRNTIRIYHPKAAKI